MSRVVQCSNRFVWIKVPNDNVQCGDVLQCPQNCPTKKNFCIKTSTFAIKRVDSIDDKSVDSNTSIVKYSENEIATLFAKNFSNLEEGNIVSNSQSVENEYPIFARKEEENKEVIVEDKTKNKDFFAQINIAGASRRRIENIENKVEDETLSIKVEDFDSFKIGRDLIFSDNKEVVNQNPDCRSLDEALQFLFEHWETKYVFSSNDGTELRDEFVWLLYETVYKNSKIQKYEVDKIIKSQDLSLSEKFFYIFYDIVFKRDPPNGFYFYNGKSSIYPLTYWFRDKNDFIDRYIEESPAASQFRLNIQTEKNLVLHFLGYSFEDKLYDDIVLVAANKYKKIVFFDEKKNYDPVHLGDVEEFIRNMQKPISINYLESMVAFLRRFEITRIGVSIRSDDNPFFESRRENLIEDDCIYSAIGISSKSESATEYDLFVSVLKEYCRAFNPETIIINSFKFSKKAYSEEIKSIVFNYMKYYCGEISDGNVFFDNARKLAWLTKSLYERNIFSNFYCENNEEILRILSLITEKEFVHRKYFSLCGNPMVCIGTEDLLITDYLSRMLQENYIAVSNIFDTQKGNPIIKAYMDVKLKNFDDSIIRNKAIEYQAQYDDFIKTE